MRKGSLPLLRIGLIFLNMLKDPMEPRHWSTLTPVMAINLQDIKGRISYTPFHSIPPKSAAAHVP